MFIFALKSICCLHFILFWLKSQLCCILLLFFIPGITKHFRGETFLFCKVQIYFSVCNGQSCTHYFNSMSKPLLYVIFERNSGVSDILLALTVKKTILSVFLDKKCIGMNKKPKTLKNVLSPGSSGFKQVWIGLWNV